MTEKLTMRGGTISADTSSPEMREYEVDEYFDNPTGEDEEQESLIVDQATAAQTIAELESEIETLKGLEKTAEWLSNPINLSNFKAEIYNF